MKKLKSKIFQLRSRSKMKTIKDKKYLVSVSTHNGLKRSNNEDNFAVNAKIKKESLIEHYQGEYSDGLLLGVFDGMGGESNGDIASEISAKLCAKLSKNLNADNDFQQINNFVTKANYEICRMLKNNESNRGGSTFALVFIKGNIVYSFSLGDSRIYLYNDGKLEQISVDHTLAMQKYMANFYTFEEAKQSPDSHKLTLFLGVDVNQNGLNAETYKPFEFTNRSKILMCSDGLYDMVSHDEIIEILSKKSVDYSQALMNKALEHGGIDNITCLVVEAI